MALEGFTKDCRYSLMAVGVTASLLVFSAHVFERLSPPVESEEELPLVHDFSHKNITSTEPIRHDSNRPIDPLGMNSETLTDIVNGEPVVSMYAHLNQYDDLIAKIRTDIGQKIGCMPCVPEHNIIKAIIQVESGSPRHRDTAFVYDPMQVANQGDHGLPVIQQGSEYMRWLDIDTSRYAHLRQTPWKNGTWDYTDSKMTPRDSIEIGTLFLINKQVQGLVGTGPVNIHTIKSGDSFAKLSEKYNTSVGILKKYNPDVDPKMLPVGREIRYRRAALELGSIEDALLKYNGGGDASYVAKVLEVKDYLDRQ